MIKDLFGILSMVNVNDKSCDVGEYLESKNCKRRESLIGKLVEDKYENKLISVTLNDYKNVCGFCRIYAVLLVIFFIINISISCTFVNFYWYLKKDKTSITNIDANTETVIY